MNLELKQTLATAAGLMGKAVSFAEELEYFSGKVEHSQRERYLDMLAEVERIDEKLQAIVPAFDKANQESVLLLSHDLENAVTRAYNFACGYSNAVNAARKLYNEQRPACTAYTERINAAQKVTERRLSQLALALQEEFEARESDLRLTQYLQGLSGDAYTPETRLTVNLPAGGGKVKVKPFGDTFASAILTRYIPNIPALAAAERNRLANESEKAAFAEMEKLIDIVETENNKKGRVKK
jgi:hypothetical protein